MNNLIIETSNLCKCYGVNMVVSHVNIHVQKGEHLWIAWTKWCRQNINNENDVGVDSNNRWKHYDVWNAISCK